ncbi:hypothetical protein [Micromonospora sp. NPDC049301]|uniref:hypothetical protein n=1 Tax=Micromonospora sp. NPDC049301 TaxID=3155723 RepID=UPI003419E5C0
MSPRIDVSDGTSERVVHLTDVSDLLQLRSYAATARVVFLGTGRIPGLRRMTQNDIATEWTRYKKGRGRQQKTDDDVNIDNDGEERGRLRRNASSNFSKRLEQPSIEFLRSLDVVILRKAPAMIRAGGLATFAARLEGVQSGINVGVEVAPEFHATLLGLQNPEPVVVLLQANILLAEFEDSSRHPADVEIQYRDFLPHLVDNLIRIGCLPPTPYSVDALILLGSLSRYALPLFQERLSTALRTPLGFRVWRALTAIVLAVRQRKEESLASGQAVRHWVKQQLRFSDRLRNHSLYPARSLDLELAIAVPAAWSSPTAGEDWAGALLHRRATDQSATLRERGTAAFGLWERAIDGEYADLARGPVSELIKSFEEEAPARPGLAWVAGTLAQNLREGRKIVTSWPALGDPCQQVMHDAASHLDVPDRIRAATETLLQHAVIKNAGVYRRRAIDTLRAGGWAAQVIPALEQVLLDPRAEAWLRCRVLFAIGFMQERDEHVQEVLRQASEDSWKRVGTTRRNKSHDFRVRVLELHSALFAVGDCFGAAGAERSAAQVRELLDQLLGELVEAVKEDNRLGKDLVPVSRALTYLLGTTAHVRPARTKEWLETLAQVDDPATRTMSNWGLSRLRSADRVEQAHEVEFDALDLE